MTCEFYVCIHFTPATTTVRGLRIEGGVIELFWKLFPATLFSCYIEVPMTALAVISSIYWYLHWKAIKCNVTVMLAEKNSISSIDAPLKAVLSSKRTFQCLFLSDFSPLTETQHDPGNEIYRYRRSSNNYIRLDNLISLSRHLRGPPVVKSYR